MNVQETSAAVEVKLHSVLQKKDATEEKKEKSYLLKKCEIGVEAEIEPE